MLTPEWLIKSAEENTRLDCDDFLAVSALKPHPWNPVKQLGSTSQPDSPMDPRAGQDDIDSFEASKLPRYCVERRTPLVCPNQELVKQLAVIRRARELESEERSSLSYSRAIAVSSFDIINCALTIFTEYQRLAFRSESTTVVDFC